MGCRKLSYYNSKTSLSINCKFFAHGLEKTASGSKKRKDYYPGGSLMPGRSYSPNNYRFGYQGSEKDDEIAGVDGAHITTLFRENDTRLLRWWSVDPKSSLTPWESPYMSMGGNPILFNDPLGDIFKIGKKDKEAKSDVQSLVRKKNIDYVQFDKKTGEVTIDFGNLTQKKVDKILKNDSGLKLISDLSTATDPEGKILTFFYGTEGETGIGLEDPTNPNRYANYYSNISTFTNKGGVYNDEFGGYNINAFVLNASTQQYSSSSAYGLKPLDNFDAKIFIGQGTFKIFGISEIPIRNAQGIIIGFKGINTLTKVSRSSVIQHELREAFLRTAIEMCYDEAHDKAGNGEASRFFPTIK